MSDLTSLIANTVNTAVNTANSTVNAAINTANNAVNTALVGVAQINAALTGPSQLSFGYAKSILTAPVGPGVIIGLPSNTDSQLALTDPLQFQGTVNFNAAIPGVTPNGLPSLVALIGVAADHWTFSASTNMLTLLAGSQVTDTLKMTPSAAGFGVYTAPATVGAGLPGGVVIASAGLPIVPPGVVALPGAIGT